MDLNFKTGEAKYTPIKVGEKTVEIRKWKVKDRVKFKSAFTEDSINDNVILESLVLNCIKDVDTLALSPDEVQYIMIKIRELSISDNFNFEWECECEHNNELNLKIDDVCTITHGKISDIVIGDNTFGLGDVKNKNFYNKEIVKQEDILSFMFAMHLDNVNGKQDFTLDGIMAWLEDLDTSDYDYLMNEFRKMIFTVDYTKEFTCEKCGAKQSFVFDEIPDFFPEDWFR